MEIGAYKSIGKGALKGSFTLVIGAFSKMSIKDCLHFKTADKQWFSFPQKEITKPGGTEKAYMNYITFYDKAEFEQIKNQGLEAIVKYVGEANDSTSDSSSANQVQSGSPALW